MARLGSGSNGQGSAPLLKGDVVHVRLAASEHAAIARAAEAAQMTISGFIRSLALEGAGVQPFLTDEDKAVFAILSSDMRAIGINLNQLTRVANRTGQIGIAETASALVDIQKIVAATAIELRNLSARGARRHRTV